MSGSLTKLAKRMRRIEKELPDRVSVLTINTTLELTEDLAARETPVDTSQALSNWTVSLARPRSFIPPHSPGKGGSTRGASASKVLTLARAALAGRKVGQLIYLSNNAPYIRRLNQGYSKQAPAGFVEGSVLKAKKYLRTIRTNLLKGL